MSKIKKFPVTYKGVNFTVSLSDSRVFHGKLDGYDVKVYAGKKKWYSLPICTGFISVYDMYWDHNSGTKPLRNEVGDLVIEAYVKTVREGNLLINKEKYEKEYDEWDGFIKPY